MSTSSADAALAEPGGAADAAVAVLWSGMGAHILLNEGSLQRIGSKARSDGCRLRRRCGWYGSLAALLAFSTGGLAHGADSAWRDIESRIQYGYYTEDS